MAVPVAKVARLKNLFQAFELDARGHGIYRFQSYDCEDGPGTAENPVAICPAPIHTLVYNTITVYGGLSYAVTTGATINSWEWAWGDGTANGSGETTTHIYSITGTYEATLTVTDSDGRSGSCNFPVYVSPNTGWPGDCVGGDMVRSLIAGDAAGYGYYTPDSGNTVRSYNFGTAILSCAIDPSEGRFAWFGDSAGIVHTSADALLSIAWTYNLGSAVNTLFVDQVSTNVIWAGCADGTLWVSIDYGRNFVLKYTSGWDGGITAVLVDNLNSNRIIISGSHSSSARLSESADFGATFTDIRGGDLSSASSVNMVQFSNLTTENIWAALSYAAGGAGTRVQRGVRTGDLAYTWTAGDTVSDDPVYDITGALYTDNQAYAVARSTKLWRTIGHPSWYDVGNGAISATLRRVRADIDCANLVWLGTDTGVAHAPPTLPYPSGAWTVTEIIATNGAVNDISLGPLEPWSPTGLPIVGWTPYSGGSGTYLTMLSGSSWALINKYVTPPYRARRVYKFGNTHFMLTDGAGTVIRSYDDFKTFEVVLSGLTGTADMTMSPAGTIFVLETYGAAPKHTYVWRSTDGGTTWAQSSDLGNISLVAIDAKAGVVAAAGWDNTVYGRCGISTDDGISWVVKNTPTDISNTNRDVAVLNNGRVVLIGYHGGGTPEMYIEYADSPYDSWTKVILSTSASYDLSLWYSSVKGILFATEVSRAHYSSDGATWTQITDAIPESAHGCYYDEVEDILYAYRASEALDPECVWAMEAPTEAGSVWVEVRYNLRTIIADSSFNPGVGDKKAMASS